MQNLQLPNTSQATLQMAPQFHTITPQVPQPRRLLLVATLAASLRAFFIPFAEHFRAKGWRVDAIAKDATSCPQCVAAFDQVWDIPWSRSPFDPNNLLKAPDAVRAVLMEGNYDLVNATTPVGSFVTRLALNRYRYRKDLKMVYTAQGFHFYKGGSPATNAAYLALEKIAGQWTDQLVVVNGEDQAAASEHRLIPGNQVARIPGTGVNTQRFNPENVSETQVVALRQELGLQAGDRFFLSVAEFIPRKRLDDILNAFAKLADPTTHLVFAGKGVLMESMKEKATALGVAANVHFLGQRSDIPVLLKASTALVLVAQHEGLPNCIIEALYFEKPVIGSDIRGTRDLLQGGGGLIVGLGDIPSITESMRWILKNPEEAEIIGKQGRRVVATYDLPQVLEQYETLYQTLLGA